MLRRPQRFLWTIAKVLIRAAAAVVIIFATLLLAQALRDRKLPALDPWQHAAPAGEFQARDADAGFGFDDYLELENRLFREVEAGMIGLDDLAGRSKLIRYVRNGPNNATTFDRDWNRTTELVPEQIRGGVLLVHGLTDSPYSMRGVAEAFQGQGFYALCMRMPGHGTVPAGLVDVSCDDWIAAVRLGARRVRERIGPGKPLVICGYSTGGALAVHYTLQALEPGDLPRPDRVFLFSPAIGITALAVASNWHLIYSWMPIFERSKWASIEPEYDPYKYNSFAKNAGAQCWKMTRKVQAALLLAARDGRLARLPPILTFQSAVDSTIIARDVVEKLYDRLPANGSELVAFDVNSLSTLDGFYAENPHEALRKLSQVSARTWRLTVVQNATPDSAAVVARSRAPGAADVTETPLEASWPDQVYSLAHVAIPFPPDDPIYGDGVGAHAASGRTLGDLSLRGEKHVLVMSANDLMRLRYNPFLPYVIRRITETDLSAP